MDHKLTLRLPGLGLDKKLADADSGPWYGEVIDLDLSGSSMLLKIGVW